MPAEVLWALLGAESQAAGRAVERRQWVWGQAGGSEMSAPFLVRTAQPSPAQDGCTCMSFRLLCPGHTSDRTLLWKALGLPVMQETDQRDVPHPLLQALQLCRAQAPSRERGC